MDNIYGLYVMYDKHNIVRGVLIPKNNFYYNTFSKDVASLQKHIENYPEYNFMFKSFQDRSL